MVVNTFRAVLAAMAALMLSTTAAFAQTDDFDFDDIPIDEDEIPYIGVGGGYVNFYSPSLDPQLSTFAESIGLDPFDGGLLIHGGGGWTVVGLIRNVRVGLYTGGGASVQSKVLQIGGDSYERSLRYRVDLTAGHLDYVFPMFFRGFAVIPGVMVGASGHTISVTQTQQGGASFAEVIGGYGTADSIRFNNRQTVMTRNNVFYSPVLNFEWAANVFVLFRLGIGYHGTLSIGDWTDGEGTTINDVPDIKPDGVMGHFGVFIGLFQK